MGGDQEGGSREGRGANDNAARKSLSRRSILNILKGVGAGLGAAVILGKETIVAFAQQITGVLGSPSATTTIPGNQLPPPSPKFGGEINLSAKESKPLWPPHVVPPKGAPNVLLIMTDDAGLWRPRARSAASFRRPRLDRVAKAGLRYTQFHSTALCSPTRAALITGRNHHSVGFGVITEQSTGYPGLRFDHRAGKRDVGAILDDNGYATSWFGKRAQHSELPVQHRRPIRAVARRGWDSNTFYGFMGGETDQWQPYLFQNQTQIFPWIGRTDYNLTTDLADEAIDYLEKLDASMPDKPFFLYLRARRYPRAASAKARSGSRSSKASSTWAGTRCANKIFANQKRLGVIPPETELTPWPEKDLPPWDSLSADEKKLFARQAEVFAAYAAYTDHEIGRVIQAVEDLGKLDNTLIIYISGDNGCSAEGSTDRHAQRHDRATRASTSRSTCS